jgi:hypothetical protein
VIAQLVDKSVTADLRATKMLLDILKDIEKAGRDGTDDQASPVHYGGRGGDRKPCGQAAARLRAGSHHTDTESTGWLIEADSITENEAFLQLA